MMDHQVDCKQQHQFAHTYHTKPSYGCHPPLTLLAAGSLLVAKRQPVSQVPFHPANGTVCPSSATPSAIIVASNLFEIATVACIGKV